VAFTITDFPDLVRLLSEHPEWQVELRRVLLADDFLALPGAVRELTEAQARTEQRLEELAQAQARTEQRLEELAQAQARTEQRLEELAQAQARTEQRLEELAQAQARTEQIIRELVESQKGLRTDVGSLKGDMLELRYINRASAYFGKLLRRARVVLPRMLDAETEDLLETHLTETEFHDVLNLDLLVQGQARAPTGGETWLAVEVSYTVDRQDIERARRRAALLRKAGLFAIPVVAGNQVTEGATEAAQEGPLVVMLDGRYSGWEAALAGF
jgi:DNA repair exonuclease SbcCD ATPase subunit